MGIIQCPECGKNVSDKASSCVHCGYPLLMPNKEEHIALAGSKPEKEAEPSQNVANDVLKKEKAKIDKLFLLIPIVLVCVIVVSVIAFRGFGNESFSGHVLSVSSFNALAILEDGTVVATGDNDYGQCEVEDWNDIVSVATIATVSIGLRSDGTVVTTADLSDFEESREFYDVSGWSDIVDIAASVSVLAGLHSDGTVVVTKPIDHISEEALDQWNHIVDIEAGMTHLVGLRSDGTVVALGENEYGECNVEEWSGIQSIVAGAGYTAGLKKDGTVVVAGDPEYVTLTGVEDWTDIVSIHDLSIHFAGITSEGKLVCSDESIPEEILEWTDLVDICGTGDTYIGLKSDGTTVYYNWLEDIGFDPLTDLSGVKYWRDIRVPE